MSSSWALAPTARMSPCACSSVRRLVAKPGIVYARMLARGRPSASSARAQTRGAGGGDPEPLDQALHLDLVDLGAALGASRRVGGHVREALPAPLGQEPPAPRAPAGPGGHAG